MATAPPASSDTIDFGRCFTFITEDPDWLTKVIVGGLFTLLSAVLVGVPFILGYWGRTVKNVAAGQQRPLPAWDDLGGIFSDGLRLVGVYLVYFIGIAVVLGLIGGVLMVPFIALGASGALDESASGLIAALGGLGTLVLWVAIMLASLAALVYLPAALVRAALRDSFAEGFAWREVVGFIKANLGNYALSLVIYLVASFVSQFGMLLCCIGFFPAAFWAYQVLAYALGETVRLNPGSV
jgi:hypothetical protein